MVVIEVSFPLSRASTVFTKLLVCVVPYWWIVPGKTLKDLHGALRWMWDWALRGQYATHDHLGNEITREHGRLRFARKGEPLIPEHPLYRMAFC
eukprot:14457651-Alexandrium_andersonii.AAC.1